MLVHQLGAHHLRAQRGASVVSWQQLLIDSRKETLDLLHSFGELVARLTRFHCSPTGWGRSSILHTYLRLMHVPNDLREVVSGGIADRRLDSPKIGDSAANILEIVVIGFGIALKANFGCRINDLANVFGELQNGDRGIAANVEDFSQSGRCLQELHHRIGDVGNMGKTADLGPVIMDN